MKRATWLLIAWIFTTSVTAGAQSPQDGGTSSTAREFIMSCTYGVMAGTLVGAASLAFTDKPSDNLNRVARGASLGLYTGILLGLYVVYVVPGMEGQEGDDVVMEPPVRLEPTFGLQAHPDGATIDVVYRF